MDDDRKENVIVMNRPKPDFRDKVRPPSPGEIAEDFRPSVLHTQPVREAMPQPETAPAWPKPEDDPQGGPESYDPASGDYKAYGWAGNRTLPSLIIIFKDGSEGGFNYCDLASAHPGGSMFLPSAPGHKGNVIRLRIAGDDGPFMTVLEGLRLRRVWELIMAHKTPWIHELPAGLDLPGGNEPVIWSAGFTTLRAAAAGRSVQPVNA